MLEAADLVVAGRHSEAVQDEDAASYEGWCKDGEARINWGAHIDQIHNLIRGCDPAPGAWTFVLGEKVRLFDARKHPVRRFGDVAGKPGEIVAIGEESIRVSVQGGSVEISRVRTESGRKFAAADFARAHGLKVGEKLESQEAPSFAAAAS
jgi:methionyl-tRNA formyltransferase